MALPASNPQIITERQWIYSGYGYQSQQLSHNMARYAVLGVYAGLASKVVDLAVSILTLGNYTSSLSLLVFSPYYYVPIGVFALTAGAAWITAKTCMYLARRPEI